jgi:hypothetical protein
MKQCEYIEGPQAFANFERFATAILQAPKPKAKKRSQGRSQSATSRKPKNGDKD